MEGTAAVERVAGLVAFAVVVGTEAVAGATVKGAAKEVVTVARGIQEAIREGLEVLEGLVEREAVQQAGVREVGPGAAAARRCRDRIQKMEIERSV